jgi:hypothetical protein
MKPLAIVPTETPAEESQPEQSFAWMLIVLNARLATENAKLLKAVIRESHHIDVRTSHTGRHDVLGRRP